MWDIVGNKKITSFSDANKSNTFSHLNWNPENEYELAIASDNDNPTVQLWDIRRSSFPVTVLKSEDLKVSPICQLNWVKNNDKTMIFLLQDHSFISCWDPHRNMLELQAQSKKEIKKFKFLDDNINTFAVEVKEEASRVEFHSLKQFKDLHLLNPIVTEKAKPNETDNATSNSKSESDEIKRIGFNQLKESEVVQKDFINEMKKRSFAILSTEDSDNNSTDGISGSKKSESNEVSDSVNKMWNESEEFFNKSSEDKDNCKIVSWRDVGYLNIEKVKEFWQMRMSDASDFPWPKDNDKFKEKMINGFNTLDIVGRICMKVLAKGMNISYSKFEEAFDHNPLPKNSFSNSILSIYKYAIHETNTQSCEVHKDMGLVTLVPRAAVPGLQVLDYSTVNWIDIEKISKPGDIVVFNGECLERMTAEFYPACIHRVVREKSETNRSSIVFKLRARPESVIDCVNLGSDQLSVKDIYPDMLKKTTVADYIRSQLSIRESVNFPESKGFVTYANCILDPNRNSSQEVFHQTSDFKPEDITMETTETKTEKTPEKTTETTEKTEKTKDLHKKVGFCL